jgi:hypothetical protein
VQELADFLHKDLGCGYGAGEPVDFVANLFDSGGRRHQQILTHRARFVAGKDGTTVI